MKEIFELEYRGLNLFDEISTVEVAIDNQNKVIHIYDINQVVEPEYDITAKKYQLSEGFYKMAKVLFEKKFFESPYETEAQWLTEITWVFYGSKRSIFKSEGLNLLEIPKAGLSYESENSEKSLYSKYVLRVL
ncbi:hypothetical protein QMK38_01825 [Lysinibacillus fusiformis]|nr:hypothetical protein [Lysinibacillus fusiformis]